MKKIFTLITLLCAVTGVWAASYVPLGVKPISGYTVVYCSDITSAGDPATDWVVVPSYGTASIKYTNTTSDSNGNPNGIEDVITTTSSNPAMIQIKTDGNTFTASKRVIHMHVKGISGVIGHGAASSSNRGMAISATEYVDNLEKMDETTHHAEVKRSSNSGSFIVQLTGLDTEKEYIVSFYAIGGDSRFYCAEFIAPDATTPTITTQPKSASYAKDATAAALTVEATASAGELSYQWYSNTTESTEGATAIDGATTASYTPSTAEVGTTYYYVVVTDDNGSTTSNIAAIQVEDAAAPTISIEASATTVAKNGALTLTATVDGVPAPTIQWYSNTSVSNDGGTAIDGATAETYAPSTATPGTYYFYAVATNSIGAAASNALTIVVTPSQDVVLTKVEYSNGFDAFIKQPTAEELYKADDAEVVAGEKNAGDVKRAAANGTITAYYLEGTDTPTINTESITVSEGATTAVEGNQLTVTAEDGVTKAVFDITVEAVAPYDGTETITEAVDFDGTETWVKSVYGFSEEEGKLGWKFSKNGEEATNRRNSEGKNRIYFFLPASKSITFTNGGTARDIKVYRNGVALSTPTSTSDCTIEGDTEDSYMIAIVSNNSKGDGALQGFTISFEGVTTAIQNVEAKTVKTGEVYNLAGQRVAAPVKGLYIVNGKKVVMK